MLIKPRNNWNLSENDVTPEGVYKDRRKFMKGAAAAAVGVTAGAVGLANGAFARDERVLNDLNAAPSVYDPEEALTPYDAVTQYNNFYEFGTDKSDPSKNAWQMNVTPWTVTVDGMVDKPGAYDIADLIDFNALQERIYRLRCVEAWSMVIPWIGVPMSSILAKIGVQSSAKYVKFETLADRKQMPGVRWPVLDWPYVEGLRLDEAMNDLDNHGGWTVRQGIAEPERRTHAACGAVEIRFQVNQVCSAHQPDRQTAKNKLGKVCTA